MSVQVRVREGNLEDMLLRVRAVELGTLGTVFSATFVRTNPFEEVILLADSSDQILSCGGQISPTLGYTQNELIGKHLNILLPDVVERDDQHLDKKRKLKPPFVWASDGVAKVIEVKDAGGDILSVICRSLPVEEKLCVLLSKVKGVHLSPEPKVAGRYSIGPLIAVGNYGKVKKATNIDTGQEVAVKIINKKLMTEDEVHIAMREIAILRSLDHPNIIHFCNLVDISDRIYIFMEYVKDSLS
jgi:PAS domain-containing protein